MKKKLLLYLLLFTSIKTFSQFGTPPTYSASELEFGLRQIKTLRQGISDNNECRNYLNGYVTFNTPITNHPGSSSDFGYYYYDFLMYVYGVDSDGNEIIVDTVNKSVNDYQLPLSSIVRYNLYDDFEPTLLIENLNYVEYFIKIKITKYITNNDPEFLLYFPESHWEQLDINREPKCGPNSCSTYFNDVFDSDPNCNDNNGDVDNDGVHNLIDNCPNIYNPNQEDSDGNGIGDVCEQNNEPPNLTLEKVTVTVDGTTYDTSDNSNFVPILKYGEQHTFNFTIKNDDNGNADTAPYELLVSTSSDAYPDISSTPVYLFRSENAGSIDGNSEKIDTFILPIYENISTLQLQENTTYYMFIHIDPDNNVTESNEDANDNIWHMEFKYENSGGRVYLDLGNNIQIEVAYSYYENSLPTNVKIYNINNPSTPVLQYNFSTQVGTIDISSLQEGIYAVMVNDLYKKKFKKKRSSIGSPNFKN